jgi:hypothetical protein
VLLKEIFVVELPIANVPFVLITAPEPLILVPETAGAEPTVSDVPLIEPAVIVPKLALIADRLPTFKFDKYGTFQTV